MGNIFFGKQYELKMEAVLSSLVDYHSCSVSMNFKACPGNAIIVVVHPGILCLYIHLINIPIFHLSSQYLPEND